ncbi:Ribosomal protein L37ae [Apiospora phragmitis]|uniref:Ribosomal protein L37ae n=1 Tax=Apiospora phragmitis TaxID=2905665 RepID=A0ABR1T2U1_9PEZI
MTKRTKKVGVTGKYGTSPSLQIRCFLRKQVKKMEITQHSKYTCTFCGKVNVKRTAVGIWNCRACHKVVAGGGEHYPEDRLGGFDIMPYTVATPAAAAMRSTLRRLREIAEV